MEAVNAQSLLSTFTVAFTIIACAQVPPINNLIARVFNAIMGCAI